MDDTRLAVERLIELVGTGEAKTMEFAPEANALCVDLLAGFLDTQQRNAAALERIADALETQNAAHFAGVAMAPESLSAASVGRDIAQQICAAFNRIRDRNKAKPLVS